ncbi:MAG: hypothetical protein JO181_08685 [Solirubrobacterales bacterium]|nr:hypothetical protein [Solirubrobacterales bacterium]
MDTNPTPTITTEYKEVTVEVPEDRVAEFHAFFARFLAGSPGRGRRGRHGRPHRGWHRRHCAGRGEAAERGEGAHRGEGGGQQAEISEV